MAQGVDSLCAAHTELIVRILRRPFLTLFVIGRVIACLLCVIRARIVLVVVVITSDILQRLAVVRLALELDLVGCSMVRAIASVAFILHLMFRRFLID